MEINDYLHQGGHGIFLNPLITSSDQGNAHKRHLRITFLSYAVHGDAYGTA